MKKKICTFICHPLSMLMKKILLLVLFAAAICACGRKTLIGVSFPEPPIEIACNEDFGMGLINYFNIIRTPDGVYRMYFSGNEESGIAENEWQQNLYLAESADGFHYTLKCKIMDAIIEQSVCLVKDRERPYRMVGSQMDEGSHCLFLWKSKDGIEFDSRKLLHKDKHDTQNVLVPRGHKMKLYSRVTQEGYKNRRVTVAQYTLGGSQESVTEILAGDFLYNNAACKLDRRYDLLFPTYYNTHGGTTDACTFRCYIADGPFVRELPCALNRWIEPGEKWFLASPGFVMIGGERYLAFNTRTETHDASHNGMISRYKLIKAVPEYE